MEMLPLGRSPLLCVFPFQVPKVDGLHLFSPLFSNYFLQGPDLHRWGCLAAEQCEIEPPLKPGRGVTGNVITEHTLKQENEQLVDIVL